MPSKKIADRVCAHAVHRLHGKKSGSFFPGFHRNKHWSFSIGAAASFTGSLAADNSVIQLNQVGKPIDAVSMGHGLPDLAQHGAGCDPGNTQVLGCSKRGNATFVRSHEVAPFIKSGLSQCIGTGRARFENWKISQKIKALAFRF